MIIKVEMTVNDRLENQLKLAFESYGYNISVQ